MVNRQSGFPVGATIPDSPHALCCSLPTLQAVIGYEEKHPAVVEKVRVGYPRFVLHKYLRAVVALYFAEGGERIFPVASARAAERLVGLFGAGAEAITIDGLSFVRAENDKATGSLWKLIQHTGLMMASRAAEQVLVSAGRLDAAFPEERDATGGEVAIVSTVREAFKLGDGQPVALHSCGMSAFFAVFTAVKALQERRGRTAWIQLGWLYLDTGKILERFLPLPDRIALYEMETLDGIRKLIAERGDIAAIVTEVPSNPLLQTCDLDELYALCREHGIVLIADPTIAGLGNVDTTARADINVISLTKFAGSAGDTMLGATIVNPESPFRNDLELAISRDMEPPFADDLARVGHTIKRLPELMATVTASAAAIIPFLEQHPGVERLYWTGQPGYAAQYAAIGGSVPGPVFSIEIRGSAERFYDALRVVKGPSFGTTFTMACPFMYLAHYDLVSSSEGQAFLRALNIHPCLIRVSLGMENTEELVDTFDYALEASIRG